MDLKLELERVMQVYNFTVKEVMRRTGLDSYTINTVLKGYKYRYRTEKYLTSFFETLKKENPNAS